MTLPFVFVAPAVDTNWLKIQAYLLLIWQLLLTGGQLCELFDQIVNKLQWWTQGGLKVGGCHRAALLEGREALAVTISKR